MVALDWIFLAILLLSMLVGAWRGLVVEILSLINWVVAFVLARLFAPLVAPHLPFGGATEMVRYTGAFLLIFIGVVFVGSVLIWLVGRLFQAAGLRPADRALGGIFGLIRGLAVLVAVAVLVTMSPLKVERWWTESTSAIWATAAAKGLKPVLPPGFAKYLP